MTSLLPVPVDATLTCNDCGEPFLFSARDQEYALSKNFASPKYCKPCRILRKQKLAEEGGNVDENGEASSTSGAPASATELGPQRRWEIICSSCGQPGTIPFMPQPGRPVRCQKCYVPRK